MGNIFLLGLILFIIMFILYIRYIILMMLVPKKLASAQKLLKTDEEKAMKILSSVLSIDRGNPQANWVMAHLYIKRKQYILSQLYLNEILYYARYTDSISERTVRETLAYTYQCMGEINKALIQYYLLKRHNKLTLEGMKKAIKLNIENNNYIEAKNLLFQAFKLYGNDGELYYLAGMIDFNKGNFSLAERKLKSALKNGFDTPEVNLLLGKVYFIMRKFKIALNHFNKLPEEYLNSTEIENLLGQCFYYLKDYKSAIALLEKLIWELRKKKRIIPDSMYILGCAYEGNGYIDKALEVWKELSQKFPYYQPVKEKIHFYTNIAVQKKLRNFIVSTRTHFAKATENLIELMDYTIKQNIYEDEKTLEYLCYYQKDPHSFNLYLICVTRMTSPVNSTYINQKLLLLNKYRAKYLTIIAPSFTDDGVRFAQMNSVTIYRFNIYEEYSII